MSSSSETTFILGTAIKLTTMLSVDVSGPIVITIKDSSLLEKISKVAMTKEVSKIYSYIYQSSDSDIPGEYVACIEATHGAFVAVDEIKFSFVKRT